LGHTANMNKGSNVEEVSAGEPHGKLAYPDRGKTFCSLPKYPEWPRGPSQPPIQ
jgi:hypothetical protein